LKDNRLKKLMEQDKLKAVLEYLTKQFQEQQKTSPTKSIQSKQQTNNNQQQQEINHKIQISHFDQSQPFKGRLSEISVFFFFFENCQVKVCFSNIIISCWRSSSAYSLLFNYKCRFVNRGKFKEISQSSSKTKENRDKN